jgi:hypothetical protein
MKSFQKRGKFKGISFNMNKRAGFVKKENQITAYSGILKFLDTYLKQEKEVKG